VPNLVCSRCSNPVDVPDGSAPAHCPRCGNAFPPSQAIQARTQPEYAPGPPRAEPEPPRGQYASWEDFRASSPALQRARLDLATRVLPDLRARRPQSLPADLPATADELGMPLASANVPGGGPAGGALDVHWTVYAGIFCALMLLIGVLEWHALHKFAVGVVVGGGVLLLGWWWLAGRPVNPARLFPSATLWLFEEGIVWQHGSEIASCRFEDIDDFQVRRENNQPRYVLVPRRGLALVLTPAETPELFPLAEHLEIKVASAQLLPKLRRILAGEAVRFGRLVLDRDGLTSPGFVARWPELVRVVADRGGILVERREQSEWNTIHDQDVSNPLLVPAIAHILIEEAPRLPPAG
jgi:hypothetical protein